MTRMLTALTAALLFMASFMLTLPAQAGVVREDKGDSDWEILLAPYLWMTGIKGTSQVGVLPPMDIDADFSDIISKVNMALALHTEFHRGKFAFVIDPTYLSLEMEASIDGAPIAPKAEVEIWLVEAWASYKLSENWEVLGGARWQSQDMDVDPGLPSPPFPEDVSFGVKDDWTDWFLGARFNYPLGSSRWVAVGRGDVSVAGDSDTNFNLSFFLNRHIRKTMMLNLGYRYMETDYDNFPKYAWDVRQQGFVVGYTWSF